jgi:large subunit ribosomal protein L4
MIRGALRSVLSDRVKAKRLLIIDEFKIAEIKTKAFSELLTTKLQLEKKVLIIDDANKNLELSARNIAHLKVLRTEGLNVYDIVRNDWLVVTKRAVDSIERRLGHAESAKGKV